MSSSEFGPLTRIAVYGGSRGNAEETLIVLRTGQKGSSQWSDAAEFTLPPDLCYLRAEAECAAVGSMPAAKAYTSAVFTGD